MNEKRSGILTIGDELLIGQITDTNSVWIGQKLNKSGWKILSKQTVGDDVDAIVAALEDMESQCQVIIVTGGLGPTSDDKTLEALSRFFNRPLILHQDVKEHIERYFSERGRQISPHHAKQFYLPQGAEALTNQVGTAPGLHFVREDVHFFITPGVPQELHYIFEQYVQPLLDRMASRREVQAHLFTAGIGETSLVDRLGAFLDQWPAWIKVAYLPYMGGVRLRITAEGNDLAENSRQIEVMRQGLKDRLVPHVISEKYDQWNEVIQHMMIDRKMTLATAESCTGGYIASQITTTPGSSAYFKGTVVSYANEVKRNVLQVREETLKIHGAVSSACAEEMLKGVLSVIRADVGVAVTGIAGPGGGSAEKPVGTVYVSVGNDSNVMTQRFNFRSTRQGIVEYTYNQAMYMIYKFLCAR